MNSDPDSKEWKTSIEEARASLPPALVDSGLFDIAITAMENEMREQAEHLVGYRVRPHGAASSEAFEVAAFSADHAARLVRTYAFPFVSTPELTATAIEPPRRYFAVDIHHPALLREDEDTAAGSAGRLAMPWAHPKDEDAEPLLDLLVAEGFWFIDIPGMKCRYGDVLFDSGVFDEGEQPAGCHKIAFVLSNPAEDISEDIQWYASKMEGPLDEEHDDEEDGWPRLEPRLVVLDGPLPTKYEAHLWPYGYDGW